MMQTFVQHDRRIPIAAKKSYAEVPPEFYLPSPPVRKCTATSDQKIQFRLYI